MSLSPKDMDFIEAKHVAAREIALALGVPPMLLGIPGDNTYANYQEANRTFWRQTVLPLVNRTAMALSAWLAPAYTGSDPAGLTPGHASSHLDLRPDLDAIEALSTEREALWTRLDKATFLTPNEKRSAVGYGPLEGGDEIKAKSDPSCRRQALSTDLIPSDNFVEKLNPYHDELGQFTTAEGDAQGGRLVHPVARGPRPPPRPPRPPRQPSTSPRQPSTPGIGHNRPPADSARPDVNLPPSRPFQPQEAIDAYRLIHDMSPGEDTVAYGVVDGVPHFGINSQGPAYKVFDRDAADQMRERLFARYPGLLTTNNIGRIPNNALYHAEATLLLRAARGNDGSLEGMDFEVHVDRPVCNSCQRVLPSLGLELGNPTVTFVDRSGFKRTMRNGSWVRRGQ